MSSSSAELRQNSEHFHYISSLYYLPEVYPGPCCVPVAGEPLRSPDLLPGDEAAVASLDLGGHLLLLRRGHRPRQVQPPPRDPVADEGARAETRDVHLLMVAVLLSTDGSRRN